MSDHRRLEVHLDRRGLGSVVLDGKDISDLVYGLQVRTRAGERPEVAMIVDPNKLDMVLEGADISMELPTPEPAEVPAED